MAMDGVKFDAVTRVGRKWVLFHNCGNVLYLIQLIAYILCFVQIFFFY